MFFDYLQTPYFMGFPVIIFFFVMTIFFLSLMHIETFLKMNLVFGTEVG